MDGPFDGMNTRDVDYVLGQIAKRLSSRFTGVFGPETVERYVFESYMYLHRTVRLQTHLPALTENFATERLTALAQVDGTIDKPVPEVLFLCAYNAGRSQLATALADRYAQGRVHVRCAGSHPAGGLDHNVVEALDEWGIDIGRAYPKPLTPDVLGASDVIVTMGCGDACPVLAGKRYLDWDIPDPAGRDLPFVRTVRDDIDARVRALIDELTLTAK
ncbi:arsenate reductase ArsC [Micromonospora sp. WMMD1155]|uniref:arsenate-mycothiol transferase ArsC n=1 Tax=Micromonospora sp. WMMD1155 TaxID=3016094 RepID=UPI00249A41B8|nr:arsenate reductase ArsC [Micromonospora sp. WMMD1155]WFE53098.1 arsenate reductase ArsC [Micromonospora sp. WMMD1155]